MKIYIKWTRDVAAILNVCVWGGGAAVRWGDPQRKMNYVHNVQSKYIRVHIINSK